MSYETLIRRAYKCDRSVRNGADCSVYHLVIDIAEGYKLSGTTSEKQFLKLKAYLLKAFGKFLKRRLKKEEKIGIMFLIIAVEKAETITDIAPIIYQGLEATQRFREYSFKY